MTQRGQRVVGIIQARMGSTRLPGKVLLDLCGETVLAKVVRRLSRASRIERMVVATTTSCADAAVVGESRRLGVEYFRGSEDDVLDRYCRAAKAFSAEAVVRITCDCPLIDPTLVDEVIRQFSDQNADFACNVLPRMYPRGLDTEVFTNAALDKASKLADLPHQREHVTPLFYERRDLFRFVAVPGELDYSSYRWTLDTPEDLELIRAIYSYFNDRADFGWREVLALMEQSPDLANLNAHITQRPVRQSTVNSRT